MNDPTQAQAREIYRTIRVLKDRVCHKFQARARRPRSWWTVWSKWACSHGISLRLDRREVRVRLSASGALHFQEMGRQILEYITSLLVQLGPSCSGQWCEVYTRIRNIIALEKASELVQHEKKEAVE